MISTLKKFIFIHIPKTGGNAIQKALLPFADDLLTTDNPNQDGIHRFGVSNIYGLKKHATLTEYKTALDAKLFSSFFKFSCIRNPWERAISYYFSPHRGEVSWDKGRFLEVVNEMQPVSHFVKTAGSDETTLDSDIDYLIRFAQLEQDFVAVCRLMNIDAPALPSLNISSRNHYTNYYDTELREFIAKKFHDEIVFGDYSFD